MTLPVGGIAGFLELQGAAAFEQGILGAQRSLTLTGESATTAAAAVDKVDVALARTTPATSGAAAGTAKLRAAQLSAVAATERYNMVLGQEDASLARLAASEASMIRANERLAASTPAAAIRATTVAAEEQTGVLAGARASMAGFAGTAAQLGLAFGVFVAIKKAIDITKEANEFQRAMVQTQTNADVTAAEVKKAGTALLGLSNQGILQGANDLAVAFYHAKSVGLDYATAIETTKVAAQGASVGNADLEETMNALTSTVASGIPGVKDMGSAMGQLIAIVGSGDMNLTQLNEAFGTGILLKMKGYGLSLTDVGAALATFGDSNIRGADAATMLRMAVEAMAKQGAPGEAALEGIGIKANQLRKDLQQGGLNKAVLDLNAHLKAAGITGNRVGGFLIDAFTKKGAGGITALIGQVDRLESKFAILRDAGASFGDKWKATTQTASYAVHLLEAKFQSAAIIATTELGPSIATVAVLLSHTLTAGISTAHDALVPFVAGWHALSGVLGPAADGLGDALGVLAPVLPVVKFLATDLLALWLAFKGYSIAYAAFNALQDGFLALKAKSAAGLVAVRDFGTGTASSMSLTAATVREGSSVMQAEFDKIAAAALTSAAAVDRAAAVEATAYADMIAASKTASDAQVLAAERAATAANMQARASAIAAGETVAAAEASATAVAVAGEEAAVGWSAILGPIAAVGIGIGLLVTMFHRSDSASKEAAAAAKAYTDALQSDSGKSSLIETVVKQLTDNDVPQRIDDLNKALGRTEFSGKQFAAAIQNGGEPLDRLRAQLEAVAAAGDHMNVTVAGKGGAAISGTLSPAARSATKLLADLNAQSGALVKAQKAEIASFKSLGTIAAPIQQVADKLHLTSDEVTRYAGLLGMAVTKSGNLVNATEQNKQAILGVADAFAHATSTGNDFLGALKTFSTSAATGADRAALIGATLKAANGDALAFAGAMAGTTTAVDGLTSAFQQQAQQLQQQSSDQEKAARGSEAAQARLSAAQARLNEVRAKSTSTAAQVRAAEASVASAQAAASNATAKAAQADALAYADTERAAIRFRKTQDGLKASIDTTAKGAGDLVSQLQGIQSAAMAAASAEFQHEGATKKAADDAYNIYRTKTRASLIDNRKELGLTRKEARALADQYFGMDGKKVKMLIEAEGADPILTVLNKIGKLLADITRQQWNVNVDVNTRYRTLGKHPAAAVDPNTGAVSGPGYASGGPINGPGPKGIDSLALTGAPGEWMMQASAVDKYGPAFMAAVNAGTFRMSGPSPTGVAAATQVHHHKHLRIDSVQLGPIHYPEQEKDVTVLPRLARQAGEQIASYL